MTIVASSWPTSPSFWVTVAAACAASDAGFNRWRHMSSDEATPELWCVYDHLRALSTIVMDHYLPSVTNYMISYDNNPTKARIETVVGITTISTPLRVHNQPSLEIRFFNKPSDLINNRQLWFWWRLTTGSTNNHPKSKINLNIWCMNRVPPVDLGSTKVTTTNQTKSKIN